MPKHSRKCYSVFTAFLLGLALRQASAELSGPIPVDMLADRADTIVPGVVTQGKQSRGLAAITVVVDRVLKGAVRPGDVLNMFWQAPPKQAVFPDISFQEIRGLFFANSAGPNRWNVLPAEVNPQYVRDTFFRLPPVATAPLVAYATKDSVTDKVIRELLLTDTYRRSTRQGTAQHSVISTSVRVRDSAALREVAHALASSGAQEDRVTGLHALLVLGDASALSSVEAGQDQILASASGRELTETIGQYYRNAEPTSVAILGRMSQSGSSRALKLAAARALAMIHTPTALPFLAQLLDSQDPEFLMYGVGGLAGFANNVPIDKHEPGPGPHPYLTPETIAHSAMSASLISARRLYYVEFWKQWWNEHRAKVSQ